MPLSPKARSEQNTFNKNLAELFLQPISEPLFIYTSGAIEIDVPVYTKADGTKTSSGVPLPGEFEFTYQLASPTANAIDELQSRIIYNAQGRLSSGGKYPGRLVCHRIMEGDGGDLNSASSLPDRVYQFEGVMIAKTSGGETDSKPETEEIIGTATLHWDSVTILNETA